MAEHHFYTNRLINEKSPYLLQHAHNPVDWYPWGEEAFTASKEQDKPIFLSIGYATCHWCHVMERESFENTEIAQLMNKNFISIKIDREELPEVDALYMDFAQSMMSGAAGWPLNVILTPELQPFFATTYLPPFSKHGLMGLKDLSLRIAELWASDERAKILSQAEKIVEVFADSIEVMGEEIPDIETVNVAADLMYKMADPVYGGIKGAPKFPIGYQSSFMLRYFAKYDDNRALFLVERTLEMMHRGGIYDHLGGGFSRYSVDEKWLTPHFEKMLYDNAILSQSYMEAWLFTKNPSYKQVSEEILSYVLREMTHPEGGFYSAEDADSEGREGKFYTWPYEEVIQILGDEGRLFCQYYDITPGGNFEGRSIINTPMSMQDFARKNKVDVEETKKKFAEQRKVLWKVRQKRVHPFKDDKILSSWNGLMIYSLAEAGVAFSNPTFIEAAVKSARFIHRHLWQDQKLLRRWRDGQAMYSGGLDEYAFLIRGLISLFEADCGTEWLKWAVELTTILEENFKEEKGAFYQTDGTDKNLLLRKCQFSDGAEPSGNAIHCENLLRLYQLTGEDSYCDQAEDILKAVRNYLDNYPPGYTYHVMNLLRLNDDDSPTIVVALNSKKEYEDDLKKIIGENFILNKVLIWQRNDIDLEELVPSTKEQTALRDQTTLYVCREGVCQQPITDFNQMKETLQKL
ncbi:MAG: thioredoxin domain-containing protein [Parachlamydiaceae bacterium]|nr:thioredoxin domain-containing protein [Parachlamydiaceae bacterium]